MGTDPIFQGTLNILEKAMDFRARRHEAVTSNIANIDTPGYKAFDVVMDETLGRVGESSGSPVVLKQTHEGHFAGGETGGSAQGLQIVEQPAVVTKRDGNTVDLDRSMANLAENNLMYNTLAQIISRKFSGLRNAIQGGSQ